MRVSSIEHGLLTTWVSVRILYTADEAAVEDLPPPPESSEGARTRYHADQLLLLLCVVDADGKILCFCVSVFLCVVPAEYGSVVALYDFASNKADELTFRQGEEFKVLQYTDEAWILVKRACMLHSVSGSVCGYFESVYVCDGRVWVLYKYVCTLCFVCGRIVCV